MLTAPCALATPLYWDVNGNTAGYSTVVGAWNGTNNFWSTSNTGTGGTLSAVTSAADDLFIQPATTNTGSITVSGTQLASSITFAANVGPTATITGGAITIGGTGSFSGIRQQSTGANTIATALTLNSANTTFGFSNSNTGLLTIGAVTGAAAGVQTITVDSSSSGGITLGGIIGNGGGGGTVALTVNNTGSGITTLSAANTYTGGTNITAGLARFTTTASMPSTGTIAVSSGGGLIVDVTGTGRFSNATSGAGSFGGILAGVGAGGNSITYAGDVTVGIDISTGGATTYSGVIANPTGSTSLSLRKNNGQNLTLTGANTYSGKTILGGGSVVASSFGNIGDASSPLGTNSTIDFLTGGNITFNGTTAQSSNKIFNIAQGDATIRADGTGAGAITLTANINPTSTSNKNLSLFGTSTNANTISGNISNGAGGALNVIKNLAGTWVLSGANTYSGGTTLSAGTLVSVGASGLGSGAITFNTSSTSLQFRNDANTSVANTWTSGGQNINNTLVVDRVTAGAAVDLTFTQQNNRANGAVFNFQKGSNVTSGTPTITFSGGFTNTDSANATIGGSGGTGPNTFSPTGVNLVINGIAASARTKAYIFQGDTTGNRLTGIFANGTGTSIRKAGTGTWTFAGTSQYTGTTEITGGTLKFEKQTALYNNTAASWTAANINAKSGTTLAFNVGGTGEFTAGNVTTLLTNLAASSSATNGMNAGSNFGFDTTTASGGSFTIGDIVADSTGASGGARGLTKLGTNTLVLSNSNTYTGATTVSQGTLLVNGSTAAGSTVGVASGAILGGTGTISGSVNVTGSLSPGASIETLATGTLSFANSSTLIHELDSSVATSVGSDLVKVTGDLNLAGTVGLSLSDIAITDVAFTVGDVFSLINYTGTWNGGLFTLGGNELADEETFSFGLNTWKISYNDTEGGLNFIGEYAGGSDSFVNIAVIPEPNVAALLGGLGALALLRRRR